MAQVTTDHRPQDSQARADKDVRVCFCLGFGVFKAWGQSTWSCLFIYLFIFILKIFYCSTEVRLIYNVAINSAVQHSDWLYMYTHPLSFRFFSHIDAHRISGRALCAVQQVPAGQSFHRPQGACANSNPQFIPLLLPFGNHMYLKVCESVSVPQISSFVSFF